MNMYLIDSATVRKGIFSTRPGPYDCPANRAVDYLEKVIQPAWDLSPLELHYLQVLACGIAEAASEIAHEEYALLLAKREARSA